VGGGCGRSLVGMGASSYCLSTDAGAVSFVDVGWAGSVRAAPAGAAVDGGV